MPNYLMFPLKVLNITQSYNQGNHKINSLGSPYKDYPIDCTRSPAYCPCDEMKVTKVQFPSNTSTTPNGVWLTSTSQCVLPDGTNAIVTVKFVHFNNSDRANLSVGKIFHRGDYICNVGTTGHVTGAHLHITSGKGSVLGSGGAYTTYNGQRAYVLRTTLGTFTPERLFFVNEDFTTEIIKTQGLSFRTYKGGEPEPPPTPPTPPEPDPPQPYETKPKKKKFIYWKLKGGFLR